MTATMTNSCCGWPTTPRSAAAVSTGMAEDSVAFGYPFRIVGP